MPTPTREQFEAAASKIAQSAQPGLSRDAFFALIDQELAMGQGDEMATERLKPMKQGLPSIKLGRIPSPDSSVAESNLDAMNTERLAETNRANRDEAQAGSNWLTRGPDYDALEGMARDPLTGLMAMEGGVAVAKPILRAMGRPIAAVNRAVRGAAEGVVNAPAQMGLGRSAARGALRGVLKSNPNAGGKLVPGAGPSGQQRILDDFQSAVADVDVAGERMGSLDNYIDGPGMTTEMADKFIPATKPNNAGGALVKPQGQAPLAEQLVSDLLETPKPSMVSGAPEQTITPGGATRQSGSFGRSQRVGQPGGYTSGRPAMRAEDFLVPESRPATEVLSAFEAESPATLSLQAGGRGAAPAPGASLTSEVEAAAPAADDIVGTLRDELGSRDAGRSLGMSSGDVQSAAPRMNPRGLPQAVRERIQTRLSAMSPEEQQQYLKAAPNELVDLFIRSQLGSK